ncbi:MAG TPA: pitrilysin family protein, partial [Thermoanaerobaculia bacterium]|nr:pitrilysin family protein [Thermoanaerobaculia bacterium]
TDAGWDSSSVSISVMSANLDKAMDYVADVVRNPTFAKEEFERERQQAIDEISVAMSEPRSLANFVVAKVLFADAPYGHNVSGTPASLAKITRDDLVKFHRDAYRPGNAILVLGGDVKADAAFALAEKQFGSWPKGTAPAASSKSSAEASAPRVVVIDMPDAGQAAVVVARRGIRRADPQFFSAIVANSILGLGYSSRLNQEVRIKRGLSYGASSNFDTRRDVGPFTASAQTKNESAAEVAGIIIDEMNRLAATDVPDAELVPRKAVIIGGFARSLETSSGIADRISALAQYGLPLSDINRYIGNVQAINAENVRTFAGKNISGTGANVVIVGNAKAFLEPLKARFENVEVIPIRELDLGAASLRERKIKQ